VLELLRPEVASRVVEWMRPYPFAMRALGSPQHIELIALAAFTYAALFATEGVGLWLEKRWAEYLTVVATTSFIPFEVWEIVKKFTFVRLAFVIVNVAIVIYLILRLRGRQHRFGRITR